MSRVLALKSSILGDYSQSNKLVEDFIKNVDQDKLTVRDLAANPLPVLDFAVATALRATEDLSQEQQAVVDLSDTLIEEVKAADTLVIAAPMYNFTIPTQLKNWIDLIARAGVTFKYTENGVQGLIEGKKAIVVTTRGGIHKDSPTDNVTPYLRTVLGFVGITDVEFIYAEALNMGEDAASKGISDAQSQLATMA
ncbi:FMN-dependent NADH-azoreductase [Vibrio parahaemolyticus]|uniref:FMN-dependent NADH:quinone oxidoreductase n=5 Tax=Vibrio parahaemolyticus TaxID=670 RepID=AZOR_VIBPA|nr:FMN-dependent NADH-azoreductase [Vibrio parahaemolyticus]Q87PP9.1 RecName: Full=FMN-dependent NADH:quinone oxidoreductase; AltName: Full=Azo-dye reductase; AltName: Full=FMN-dependent NADH-azo compound oxidoreductase; AltName: Full=FMN-dependent NADH-azoreductase [Vibrio parahaemolyticus RIMD 2210633]EFO37657.1 FMN-dependent NADH-azoreductase [Vibrio parahaemolyticus Peru-466]EFO51171.1 FMN-dependent NADH-azoreductase [Vibrio parahaemolyticus K5030]ARC17329.1 FMN-dependent NADH-azoreductase 